MNEGVELLIKRMDSNPEEFWPMYTDDDSSVGAPNWGTKQCRFYHLMANFVESEGSLYRFLEAEDFNALRSRINKFRQDEFSAQMFSRIVGGTDLEAPKPNPQWAGRMPLGGQTPLLYSAQQQANQATQAHIALHQQQLAMQAAQQAGASGLLGNGLNSLKGFFGSNP